MMRWVLLVGLVAGALATRVGAEGEKGLSKEEIEKEKKLLNGTWRLVSSVREGKEVPVKEEVLVIVEDGKYTVKVAGKVTSSGTDVIDPTTKPKRLDTTPAKEKGYLGIYELKGDELRVCFAPPGGPRPAKFESKPGSGNRLDTYRRVK